MNFKLVIAIIILAFVLVLGGWYLYSVRNSKMQQTGNETEQQNNTPDSTANIEAELNAQPSDNEPNNESNNLNQSVEGF